MFRFRTNYNFSFNSSDRLWSSRNWLVKQVYELFEWPNVLLCSFKKLELAAQFGTRTRKRKAERFKFKPFTMCTLCTFYLLLIAVHAPIQIRAFNHLTFNNVKLTWPIDRF